MITEKIFDLAHPVDPEHYTADFAIVWCYDHRFSDALSQLIARLKPAHYDLISVAGGAKALTASGEPAEKEYIFSQIKTSIELHHTKKIILMNHMDCGAYGGSARWNNDPQLEMDFHVNELRSASDFLWRELGDEVEVQLVYMDFNKLYRVVG